MFKKTLPAFTLFLIVLLCGAIFLTTNEGFTTNASNLDNDISKKPKVLVLFYNMDCGFCKDLKPIWDDAQQQLPDSITSVDCSNADSADVKAVVKKYKITSYPRMIFFNNGIVQEDYEGPRTTDDIVKYVTSKVGSESNDTNDNAKSMIPNLM